MSPGSFAALLALTSTPCVLAACVSGPTATSTAAAAPAPPSLVQRAHPAPAEEVAQRLAPLVGEWDVELADLAGGGEVVAGRARIGWELGGRLLRWDTRFALEGREVRALGLLGYDARSGEVELLWSSESEPRLRVARGRGELDPAGIELGFEERDPATGRAQRARSRLRLLDADRFVFEQLDELGAVALRTAYQRAEP